MPLCGGGQNTSMYYMYRTGISFKHSFETLKKVENLMTSVI